MAKNILTMSAICVLLILVAFPELVVSSTKDGFNIYKDLLRGKGEEDGDLIELIEDPRGLKVSYFYRTPAQLGLTSGLRGGQNPSDLGKRTLNQFKNYMLGKENLGGEEELRKRGAGTLLSWALANRHNFNHESQNAYPGTNHPAGYVE